MSAPDCSVSGGNGPPTSLTLRLGAAGIILVVSAVASSFPSLARREPRIEPPEIVFFIGKHFGTGVILATAFVHLLPEGFESLSNPCLGGKWKEGTGFLVLLSFLAIFFVEYISTAYVERISTTPHTHSHSKATTAHTHNHTHTPFIPYHDEPVSDTPIDAEQNGHAQLESSFSTTGDDGTGEDYRHSHLRRTGSIISAIGHHRHESPSSHQHRSGPRLAHRQRLPSMSIPEQEVEQYLRHVQGHGHGPDMAHEVSRKTRIVTILVLQVGIMLHSVVIGLTLSITDGTDFSTLLTAIVFHQLFEGLSLGIRISTLPSGTRATRILPVILCTCFAITAPMGMVIGIAFLPSSSQALGSKALLVQQYLSTTGGGSQELQTALLTQGLLCALSAGMLIYAAAVEMLAGDFVMDPEMRQLSIWKQALGLGSLVLGTIAMAVISIWS